MSTRKPQATRRAASKAKEKKMAANKKFGKNRFNTTRKVVRMRTKNLMSWAAIAAELEIAPRTARRLFQERSGAHQHHDHLPAKGGRFPAQWTTVETPVLPGNGSYNSWEKMEVA
jgi:hypothetical protein